VTGPTAEIHVRQVFPQRSGVSTRHSKRIEDLGLSLGALPAKADRQEQASTRPPNKFRITLPLSLPELSTVVQMHRRLLSLLRKLGVPPCP
jgi:hypothetical protein